MENSNNNLQSSSDNCPCINISEYNEGSDSVLKIASSLTRNKFGDYECTKISLVKEAGQEQRAQKSIGDGINGEPYRIALLSHELSTVRYYVDQKECISNDENMHYVGQKECISDDENMHYVDQKECISDDENMHYVGQKECISDDENMHYVGQKECISDDENVHYVDQKECISDDENNHYDDQKECISDEANTHYVDQNECIPDKESHNSTYSENFVSLDINYCAAKDLRVNNIGQYCASYTDSNSSIESCNMGKDNIDLDIHCKPTTQKETDLEKYYLTQKDFDFEKYCMTHEDHELKKNCKTQINYDFDLEKDCTTQENLDFDKYCSTHDDIIFSGETYSIAHIDEDVRMK